MLKGEAEPEEAASGGGLDFGLLKPMQEIHGLLRVRGGAENRALVVLESRQ